MKKGPVVFILVAMSGLIAWPAMPLQGKAWPQTACLAVTDAWARIELAGRFFHDLKNLLTELFRCDAQWWAKFSSFMWTAETMIIIALLAWIFYLGRGRT